MNADDRIHEQSVFHCETCGTDNVSPATNRTEFRCRRCDKWRAKSGVEQLGAIYCELVGYDPFEDDPTMDPDMVRETIEEMRAEISGRNER